MPEEVHYRITVEKVTPLDRTASGYQNTSKDEVYSQTIPEADFMLSELIRAVNWPHSEVSYSTEQTITPRIEEIIEDEG